MMKKFFLLPILFFLFLFLTSSAVAQTVTPTPTFIPCSKDIDCSSLPGGFCLGTFCRSVAVPTGLTPVVFPTSPPLVVPGGDPSADLESIFNTADCGKEGKACCSNEIHIPIPQFRAGSEWGLIGPAVNAIASPLNTFLRGFGTVVIRIADITKSIFDRPQCQEGLKGIVLSEAPYCRCDKKDTFNIINLCDALKDPSEKVSCRACNTHGFWTAIGCIDFKLETFIKEKLFVFGVGLAGIIALLCIIYSAFTLQTAGGNPEKLKKAQEMLTSCIIGLILIIFSVFILKVIGVDILRIPGFGG